MRFGRLAFSLPLALLLALPGCQRPARTTDGSAATPADHEPTLTLYTALDEAEWDVMRNDVFPPFEQAHQCHIRAVEVESSDMANKLYALKQGGHMDVDVIGQDNMLLAPLVDEGLVEDLTPYEGQIPRETVHGLVDEGLFGGHLYFMPYRPNVPITFYNEPYLAKYGLRPPRTWDELMHVAKTLYQHEGIGRIALWASGTADTTVQLFDFINQAGGNPLVLNDAGCVKAFTFLQELWPYVSPESRRADFNTMNQILAMDEAYVGQNWPFAVDVIVRQGEKHGILAYSGWRGPVREAHTLGGEVFAIPAGAPNKDLALAYIRYIESKPVQAMLVTKLAWPSMRTDAYGQVPDWQRPYFEAVKDALSHAIARPNVPYWAAFDKAIEGAFYDTVIKGEAVQPTLDRYAAQLQAARELSEKQAAAR